MNQVRRLNPSARYSQATIYNGLLYSSGQVDTSSPDVATQTTNTLAKIDDILAQAGTTRSDIVSANVWLSDISTYDEMNRAWESWIDPENPPARATVESKLAKPEFKVEISVIAVVGIR